MKEIVIPSKPWRELTDNELGGQRKDTACLVRYGGFGDALQISSIFPLIKKKGMRVCVNVTERGYEILRNDPNIDELLIQKTNQVPNEELGPYWERLGKLFDCDSVRTRIGQFTNLGGIIEQGLLCLEGQDIYSATHEERHAKLNGNYSELLHRTAKVDPIFKVKFYPTSSERKWVKQQRKKMKLSPHHYVVVITLSGSSVHKAYPYMDSVIAKLLTRLTPVRIVMVGEEACKILESGWEREPKIFLRSGKWNIRKTIAFTQQADLVLGPETGVLNAVSSDDMAKVCLLSHSSHENLTKHWINTTSLCAEDVSCYPCHQMHFGFKNCNRDAETGGAMCAAKINPEDVVLAISHHRKLKYDISGTLSNG